MRFFQSLSFRSKIVAGITAVVLVFGILSAVLVSRLASGAMLTEIKKRGLSLGLSLAARSADPMLALDFLRLKNMVDEVMESSDDIIYVFVQDRQGQVLSHTFKGGFPVALKNANVVPPEASQHIELLAIDDEELVYDFALPVTISHERLGTVRVGLSRLKAQAAVQRLVLIILAVSLGAALVAVGLGTIFARTVTRRLDLLRTSAEDIVRGHLDVQTGPLLQRNCWDIKGCDQPACPAYGDPRRRCWYLSGTLCPECAPGGFDQKIDHCRTCPVFWETKGDEIQALAEAFDFMALSLKNYIGELKAAERNITRQQQLLQTILTVTPDPISLQDATLVYQAANPAFHRYFCPGATEVIGKTAADLFPEPLAAKIMAEDQAILATGTPLSKEILVRRNHKKYWFHMLKVPVYHEDAVSGLLCTARDITDLKQYQQQLLQSVKMEELGKLAGGVAHEINTPLCIILGYAQMLLEDLPQDSDSHEYLKIIEKQAQITRRIVADLLSFSRSTDSRLEDLHLNHSLEEVIQLVRHIFKQDWVDLQVALDPNIPPIRGDREKLKQVWLNLLNNAFEAVGPNGTIWLRSSLCACGRHALIAVADSGPGITPEDLERVFDPFFSTKPPGMGTGLGLSVSFGIVQEHRGRILAISPAPPEYRGPTTPDKKPAGPGALFLVELPLDWEHAEDTPCPQASLLQAAALQEAAA